MNKWFAEKLLTWYQKNKRELPWREEKDPYKIWLSEVILQQTQVVQGLGYYHRFVERFPDVHALAKASPNQVMKLWEGLGYYSRARNLHETSKLIVGSYNGKFPANYEQLLCLKGIGHYTAAAIASFAFDLPHAVVDGNVYRVLSRVFGVETPIDSGKGKKEFQLLADSLLPGNKAATYNQAIMDFGSQFCKPRVPDCGSCVFASKCFAYAHGRVEGFPVKEKKIKTRPRFFNYLVFVDSKHRVAIQKRNGKDIWQGLHEFPLIETSRVPNTETVLGLVERTYQISRLKKSQVQVSSDYKHTLSHQTIHARFYWFQPVQVKIKGTRQVALASLNKYAFPRLIHKFLKDCELKEIV